MVRDHVRPFYGRAALLGRLRAQLADIEQTGQGRMLAVRGRRQTGKSRVLTELVESSGLPYLFFTGVKDASPPAQLDHLITDVRSARRPLPDADVLFAARPASWHDAFSRIAAACATEPTVVILDEFPWAWGADPTLDGVLQNIWDKRLEASPTLFALVGSDLAMMERLTAHDRPLHGRTKDVVVEPFNPAECAAVLGSDAGAVAALDAYLVTGGYPRLVSELTRAGTVGTFVKDQFADENSDLVVVGQRSLDAEFPEGVHARRVLSAIGAHEVGHATFSSVVGKLGDDNKTSTATTRAVKMLTDTKRILAVDRPVGAKPSTKLRRYRIDDSYLRFWFRFVEQQISSISRGRHDIAIGTFERDWSTWRGKAIEPVVHDAVFRLAGSHPSLTTITEVGSWWNRSNSREYDIVAADRGHRIVAIGTVKWRPRKQVTGGELATLTEGRSVIPRAGGARLLAVAPTGAAADAHPDLVLTADDLLGAWPT